MGIFNKKKKVLTEDVSYRNMTVDEALRHSRGEKVVSQSQVLEMVDDSCKQLRQIEKLQKESKTEFAAVTAYLSDISRIESIPQTELAIVRDIAENIIQIEQERKTHENSEKALSEKQYANLKLYEDEISEQISYMEENEHYQLLVNNDLKQLEGEKGAIVYDMEQQKRKQSMLRTFAIAAGVCAVCAFALLLFLMRATDKDFTVPFFAAGVMSLAAAFYVLVSMRSASFKLMQDEQKMKRVISLLNKVKIKYVNVTNVLEYTYDKYNVHSHHELAYRWQLYLREKKEEEKQQKNMQRLNVNYSALVDELKRWQITDCTVWTKQPEALVDYREMTAVKHRLEDRRNKLRAAIEFGNKQLDIYRNEIDRLVSKYPEQERVIRSVLKEYGM